MITNKQLTLLFFLLLSFCGVAQEQKKDSLQWSSLAQKAFDQLERSQNFADFLTPDVLVQLPVGLKRTVNNTEYLIAISKGTFYEDHAELTVFAKVIPNRGSKNAKGEIIPLLFGVDHLRFSYKGGLEKEGKLALFNDYPLLLNQSTLVTFLGTDFGNASAQDKGSYLSIDCSGFKELKLDALVEVSRNLLIPCTPDNKPIEDPTRKVSAHFTAIVSDWSDIVANISLPKFQVKNLKDFIFDVKDAVFDFSDIQNLNYAQFPSFYKEKYISNLPDPNNWRGLFVKNITMYMPAVFKKKGSENDRITASVQDLIVDNNGLTCIFNVKDLLSYEQGSASGWSFSVDSLSVHVEANNLRGAGFSGDLGLPVSKDGMKLGYTATYVDGTYTLIANIKKELDFGIFGLAKAHLESGSGIKLLVNKDKFIPEATLYGKLNMNVKLSEDSKTLCDVKGVTFRKLVLSTQSPYISAEYFGYDGQIGLSGFPVSINKMELNTWGEEARLSMDMSVALANNKFKGDTKLIIAAVSQEKNGIKNWTYEKTILKEINIKNAEIAGLSVKGNLLYKENDPVFGNGFSGSLDAQFTMFTKSIDLKANALFGCKTFRYWYVDGTVDLPAGIPLGGTVSLKGFSGGAYYGMSSTASYAGGGVDKYTPNGKVGLGLKAGVILVGSGNFMKGEAALEVAFNRTGGMNNIGFYGMAEFMPTNHLPDIGIANKLVDKAKKLEDKYADKLTKGIAEIENAAAKVNGAINNAVNGLKGEIMQGIDKNLKEESAASAKAMLSALENQAVSEIDNKISEYEAKKTKEPNDYAATLLPVTNYTDEGLKAILGIKYDFENKVFNANFQVYVNVAKSLIKGVGQGNRAGWAVIYIAPKEWYVYMGTPTEPIGVRIGVKDFYVQTTAYFVAGTKIPGSPSPPKEVSDILGVSASSLDYMKNLNDLGDGKGFGFGASVKMDTGDMTFLFLYARLQAGLGFDVMLKNYSDWRCKGSTAPIGINGWYANAQAYAYLQGKIGAKIRIFRRTRHFDILKAGAAALVQAKLPNPSVFEGYLGLHVRVLGGLIDKHVRFHMKFGDDCELERISEKEVDIQAISDLTPHETTNVDVFAAPQLALNFPAEKVIEVEDEQGKNKTYRLHLDQFDIMQGANKLEIKQIKWNNNKDIATIYSKEILPPQTQIKVIARVSFEEYKYGTWQVVYSNGQKEIEEKIIEFTTGDAPKYIPLHNIEYAWPVIAQQNFYSKETGNGYIQLKRGQSYLFNIPQTTQNIVYTTSTQEFPTNYSYDISACRVNFPVPADLPSGSDCELSFTVKPILANSGIGATTVNTDTIINNNMASEIRRSDKGLKILEYQFKNSKFGTFAEKMSTINLGETLLNRLSSDLLSFRLTMQPIGEPFDLIELKGCEYTLDEPLVQPYAVTDDYYFTNHINPILYQRYPYGGVTITNRDVNLFGLVPIRSLPISISYLGNLNINNNTDVTVTSYMPYIYNLFSIYKDDMMDLQNQLFRKYLGTEEVKNYKFILESYFPVISTGKYKVNYQYVLPGNVKGSSYIINYER